jgi:hypothetical protein
MTAVMEVLLLGSAVGALDGVGLFEAGAAVGAGATSTVGRRCASGVRGGRTMMVVGGGEMLAVCWRV